MEIDALDCSKSHQENDFPAKIMKKNRDIFSDNIAYNFH